MKCLYCGLERPENIFQKFKYKNKIYQRKKCNICISEDKKEYYLLKLKREIAYV